MINHTKPTREERNTEMVRGDFEMQRERESRKRCEIEMRCNKKLHEMRCTGEEGDTMRQGLGMKAWERISFLGRHERSNFVRGVRFWF